jgi:DNA (cytosine-5)-methyltransferase 1
VLFVENVEEIEDWCPLGEDGRPDPERRGENFRRWVARLQNLGYQVEWRKLRASHFGAPTSRQRLFIIARCDGRPIVWPVATHGVGAQPFRTAAECIDFSLPVPSIFLTSHKAKAWAKAHGQETPRRPLAPATLRRIARGVQRFVIDSADPFIVGGTTPLMVNTRHADDRVYSVAEPFRTIVSSDREIALVAPTLIQTSYGERKGQAPRVLDLHEPLGTIVAGGIKHSLVAAFLAKHNGGHEATGQRLGEPAPAVTCKDSKALVTSHLMKLYGTAEAGQQLALPMPTVTSGGNHIAEVRAFLMKYYGTKADGCALQAPLDTITTKGRYGVVTVAIGGEEYAIVDIGMRMLTPRELFRAQGFPEAYQIEHGRCIRTDAPIRFTKKTQTRLVGNSVPPDVAEAIISANLAGAAA